MPKMLRKLNGVPLSMGQVNQILDKANRNSAGANDFSRALGRSRVAFLENHTLTSGRYVPKAKV